MEFSIATLLSHFSDDKLVAGKVLEKKLGCQDEESAQKLQIALDLLEKINVLTKERGKYRRVQQDDVVEAKLRCSSKGFCFAIQDAEGEDDVYIRESHLSNAWNGDRVLVKIRKEGSRRRSPEGEVKVILERANPSLLAKIKQGDEGDFQAVPLDDRLLFELDLRTEAERLQEAIDHLVHVEVLRYPLGSAPPIGRVTKVLGSDAEEAADTDIVICKHDLPQKFREDALLAAEALPKKIQKKDISNRLDLRKALTIAFEDTTEDVFIENAFTLEQTQEEGWRIGIHVTDVAHYIESGSPLDRTAKKRGTAIHLGEMLLPLFPEAAMKHFSLTPGEDKLAMTIFLVFDKLGELLEFEIQPSVINVDHLFSYQEVQNLLGSNPEDSVTQLLFNLFFSVCPIVKAKRQQRGSFDIESLSLWLPYKDEGRLGAITTSSVVPVRSLLSDLVVVAGEAIASHFKALSLPGIYCTQLEPDMEELEDMLKLSQNLGLHLPFNQEEEIKSQDYQHLTEEFIRSSASKVLNYLLQSTLRLQRYSTKPGVHFGLAYSNGYTHFISPGQRYADLLAQRILSLLFKEGRDRRHARTKKGVNLGSSTAHGNINWNVLPPNIQEDLEFEISSAILHLNDREKIAEDAEKDLQGLRKAEKMKERTGKIFTGLITGVQSYGFFVEIEDLLVEGLVHVSSLKDDWYEYRARHCCLVGRKNRTAYRLGDRVDVQVKSVDYYRQQIDLVTVGGGSKASNEDFEDN